MTDGLTTTPVGDARTRILDAAEAIVQARGVPALTLEAAARQAGVSKGGLLYHFGSKEALLVGLLNRLAEGIRADFDRIYDAQAPGPGRAARTILAWAFDEPASAVCAQHERAAAVFLAAFHQDPALLDPIRAVIATMRARLAEEGLAPGIGSLVMAAADGLFMAQVFGLYAPSAEDRAAMRGQLAGLLDLPR